MSDEMHCIQYAIVGDGLSPAVYHTEGMSDEEVRNKITSDPLAYGPLPSPSSVNRFNRCPACEEWTTLLGKLRINSNCPAVVEARKSGKAMQSKEPTK